jgi:hypothetical protein
VDREVKAIDQLWFSSSAHHSASGGSNRAGLPGHYPAGRAAEHQGKNASIITAEFSLGEKKNEGG